MYLDVTKMKKRKSFGGTVEELNLPAPKHKCCMVATGSECDSLSTKPLDGNVYTQIDKGQDDMDEHDTGVESDQESSSFPGDSHSSAEVKFDAGSGNTDSFDEASPYLRNSRSGVSVLENRILGTVGDGDEEVISSQAEHYPCQDMGCHDIDCHDGSLNAENFKDRKQHIADGLEEFLSSSGMDPNLLALSSERWSIDQDAGAKLGKRRPTIDQEFQQYFSKLML